MQGFWQGQSPAQPSWPALALGLVLVVLGNALSALPGGAMGDEGWPLVGVKLALLGLALAWARKVAGLGLGEIGLGERGWWRHGLLGVGVGAIVAAPMAAYLLFPVGIPGGQVAYQGEEARGLGPFLLWALVRQPLATSLFEELLFRGILQALAIRSWGVVRGVAWVSLAFALWHLVVNYRTIRATAVGHVPALFWLAQLAALIGVAAGSLVLSILRLRTGGLSAPVGFHWAVVVTMRGALLAAS